MDNDSATGGYLTPGSPAPADDACLARQIQQVVVGITGLEGRMVRPRWQPVPPPVPEADQDWCAVGVMAQRQDGMPALVHDGTGEGTSTLRRHSTLEILATFYGPNAEGYATLLADGLYIAQNRDVMMRQGLALIDVDPARNTSDLQNTIWRRKVDLPFRLRRRVDRVYAVRNLAGARGTIHYDGGSISGPLSTSVPFSTEGQS